jgi:hypothetical protein
MYSQEVPISPKPFTTPVLFIVFNRPDTTQEVFEAIRKAKPTKLFIAADGPRMNRPGETEKCALVRRIIDEGINWPCEVYRLNRDKNLGCKLAPSSAISWFFENVEEGIVLEDDCLPHPTFFRFCAELLEKYRDDERVMNIGGFNPLGEWKSDIQSYHFCYHGATWGWASWRRAWRYFDLEMNLWSEPEARDRIRDVLSNPGMYNWLRQSFNDVYHRKLDTAWDYQWLFARLLYSGLSVVPCVNLVSNIGFHDEATHTFNAAASIANSALYPMSFPLKEPYGLANDREYDHRCYLKSVRNQETMGLKEKALYRLSLYTPTYIRELIKLRILRKS